ncbi:hypothetical protein RSAG8_10249, partial [Rhizoctonia solani AG-8 WAC10335]
MRTLTAAFLLSLVFAMAKQRLHNDSIAPFITRHGVMYGLLKEGAHPGYSFGIFVYVGLLNVVRVPICD